MNKPTVDEVLAGLSGAREEDAEEPNRYTAVMVTAKTGQADQLLLPQPGRELGWLDGFAPPTAGRVFEELSQYRHGRGGQGRDLLPVAPF